MPKETKSNGQKDILDRFYTPLGTAKACIGAIDLTQYDCIIEPSAGCGNFSNQIQNCLAYDISPAADNITKEDWLKLDKTQFNSYKNILVIGNPPFGQQSSLAIQFFNEAATFCNTIAFILPLSFKKDSIQNRLDLNFKLSKEILLPNNRFLLENSEMIEVPCVFQVWERQAIPRTKVKLKTTTPYFSFVSPEQADLRIQRVGGNAGKASFDLTKSKSSNYFIKNNTDLTNEEFLNFINSLSFPTLEFTVGPKSLPKTELIAVFEENYLIF